MKKSIKINLGKSFILSVLVQASGAPLAFIASVIIAKLLGPESFGDYMVLLSMAYLVGGVAVLGCDFLLVREIASQAITKQNKSASAIGHWCIVRSGIASIAGALSLFCWLLFIKEGSGFSLLEMLLASVLVLFTTSSIIVYGFLRGFGRVVLSQALSDPIRNFILLLSVVFLFMFDSISSEAIISVQVVTFISVTIFGWMWMRMYLKLPALKFFVFPNQSVLDTLHHKEKKWRMASWHFFLGSAGVLTLSKLDVVVMGFLGGSVNAGIYSAGVRLGLSVAIVGLAGQLWLQSRVAESVSRNSTSELVELLRKSFIFIGGGTIVVSIVVGLFADIIVSWLGVGFEESALVLQWICVGYVFWSLALPLQVFLQMSGRESLVARFVWLQVFINISLNFMFIPVYGAIGGAWAWSVGMAVTAVLCFIYGKHNLKNKVLMYNDDCKS